MYPGGWNEERVLLLRKLWGEGLSASQIAKQLGGVSRNAVIGKVHRIGLAGRSTPSRPSKRPVRMARPRISAPAIYLREPRVREARAAVGQSEFAAAVERSRSLQPVVFEDGLSLTVLELSDTTCRFPIGDPTDGAFAFCGRGACSGPYCSDHAKLCYAPSAIKQRKPRTPGEAELRRLLREVACSGPYCSDHAKLCYAPSAIKQRKPRTPGEAELRPQNANAPSVGSPMGKRQVVSLSSSTVSDRPSSNTTGCSEREHGWVGNRYGPVAELVSNRPPSKRHPGEAAYLLGLWQPDSREHGWVGNRYGPVAELVSNRPPPKKNPGGDVTREAASQTPGLIDPWREPRGRALAAED